MASARSADDQRSIEKFLSLLSVAPAALVLRCKKCSKLRETTQISDPMLAGQPFECLEMGSSCDLSATIIDPAVRETEPHPVPGSFVVVSQDDVNFMPGMIDFIPGRHPAYEDLREAPFSGYPRDYHKVYHVSLLNGRDQAYVSDTYFTHQITPLTRSTLVLMRTDEARQKHEVCLRMLRTDIRKRLYKFSYMAHRYGLEDPLPEPLYFKPVRYGPVAAPNAHTKEMYLEIFPDGSGIGADRFIMPFHEFNLDTPEGAQYLKQWEESGVKASNITGPPPPRPPPRT